MVFLVGASLSRTSLVVSCLLIAVSRLQLGRGFGWVAVGAAVLQMAVNRIPALRSRVFEGDTSLQVGGVAVSATGRTALWDVTLDSIRESPWIGHGAGSLEEVITARVPGLGHPHQDYLRIWHDYGTVGLALWIIGYLGLMVLTARGWSRCDRFRRLDARIHLAAFVSLLGVALAIFTDNAIVYVFVMGPLGVLVGTSRGLDARAGVPGSSQRAPGGTSAHGGTSHARYEVKVNAVATSSHLLVVLRTE